MTDLTIFTWPTHQGPSRFCNHAVPYCPGCQRQAYAIESIQHFALLNETTAEEFVRQEEGTYNPSNEHFLCDDCFIRIETASGGRLVGPNDTRWVCP
jgi:hypothetical protein